MGNVGNIEKVMVFGILAIIICILCIAVWGHNAVSEPENVFASTDGIEDLNGIGTGGGTTNQGLKRTVELTGDDVGIGSRLLPVADDPIDEVVPAPLDVTERTNVEDEPAPAALPRTHTIQPGDTFSALSVLYFGTANLSREFEKVNEDVDPVRLMEGMVINVPQLGAEVRANAALAPAPVTPGPSTTGGMTYVIQGGDTLSGISRQFYGSPNKWRRIADANPSAIPNPDRLKVGVEIVIP